MQQVKNKLVTGDPILIQRHYERPWETVNCMACDKSVDNRFEVFVNYDYTLSSYIKQYWNPIWICYDCMGRYNVYFDNSLVIIYFRGVRGEMTDTICDNVNLPNWAIFGEVNIQNMLFWCDNHIINSRDKTGSIRARLPNRKL